MIDCGAEGRARRPQATELARPLIATDVPGIRHFLRDGIEGLLTPPGNVAAIAAALQQLAGDAEQRLQMGEAARRRLFAALTEAHVEQALLTSYQRMLTARLSVSAVGHEFRASGVHPLPRHHGSTGAEAKGDPRHRRQLRDPQASQGVRMARPAFPLDLPLHPNIGILAQHRGGLLRQTHAAAAQARRVPIRHRIASHSPPSNEGAKC